MLQVLGKCFPDQVKGEWNEKLLEMVPTYGQKLADNPDLTEQIRKYTKEKLELHY